MAISETKFFLSASDIRRTVQETSFGTQTDVAVLEATRVSWC